MRLARETNTLESLVRVFWCFNQFIVVLVIKSKTGWLAL